MARVSSKLSGGAPAKVRRSPQQSPYVASKDYGTRGSERRKQVIRVGKIRGTIYLRSDIECSSWYVRFHLKEEGRNYRKSLQTIDLEEARDRAHTEIINVLVKVQSGQRILAVSLKDLLRRFSAYQQSLVESGQLSPRTLAVQDGRVRRGCEFLKTVYPAEMETKISSIDGTVFGAYLKWRQEDVAKKRAQGTIRRDVVRDELLVIRKMFLYAKKERLCTEKSIPAWDFAVEKEGPKRRRITITNFRDFINTAYSWAKESSEARDRYNCQILTSIVALVSGSGMRSGEVFGLRNSDVQKRGEGTYSISIRAATSKVRKGRQLTVVSGVLAKWLKDQQRHRDPNHYLFCPYDDGNVSARDVFYHSFKSLRVRLKEIDLDWFDLYHCRHWWITQRLLAEEQIALVAQAAGTSVKEIENTYSHVLTELTTKKFGEKKIVWEPDGSSYKIIKQLEST